MSTNAVPVTPGAGANVTADTVGTGFVQVIKLWDATAGSSNALIVGPDGALHANITSGNVSLSGNIVLGNSTNTIGALVANQTVQVTNTPNVTINANASVNVDQVGGAAYALGNQTAANSMPVVIATNQASVPVTPAANSTVNVTQVGGGNLALGNATAANSVPVVIATNQGAVPVTLASTTITGNVNAIGPTAVGVAAGSAPVLIAGTANATATGLIQVPKIDGGGNLSTNTNQIGGTAVLTGGVNGSQGVGGLAANNASASGNPVQASAIAINAEAAVATNGQNASLVVGLEHKLINLPYANKENMVRGTANIANTTANVTIIAAQGASQKIYVTGMQASNTGNTTITITTNDSVSSVFIVPAGGGTNPQFSTPLVTAANATFAFTCSANTTTAYVSAQGYFGT
jgi:hypothetical protein